MTAGAAANAAVLADNSTMAAISFFISISFDGLILKKARYAPRGGGGSSAGSIPRSAGGCAMKIAAG
jgi:hypothetical protein